MTWQYSQSSGNLSHNGAVVGQGYSGTGTGRDNPAMQNVPNTGPIPVGNYDIGSAYQHPSLGPTVMNLEPNGHNALGRTHFRIHGNNVSNDASEGCIILPPAIRNLIMQSGDNALEVTP